MQPHSRAHRGEALARRRGSVPMTNPVRHLVRVLGAPRRLDPGCFLAVPLRWLRGRGPALGVVGGAPAAAVQSLGAVEEQVESELELELLIAAPADPGEVAARRGHGDLQDVRVPLRELGRHRLLGLRGQGWRAGVGRFVEELGAEPPDAVAQGVHHVVDQVDRETAGPERPGHRVHVAQDRRGTPGARLDGLARPRVAQHHSTRREHALADAVLPIQRRIGRVELADDDVDHAVEQLVLVGDVLVQRHRDDPQLLRQAAHAHPGDADLVGQGDRGAQHPVTVERGAPALLRLAGHRGAVPAALRRVPGCGHLLLSQRSPPRGSGGRSTSGHRAWLTGGHRTPTVPARCTSYTSPPRSVAMTNTPLAPATVRPSARPLRRTALVAGVLYLITFATSIPTLKLYAPLRDHADFVLGAGSTTGVMWGPSSRSPWRCLAWAPPWCCSRWRGGRAKRPLSASSPPGSWRPASSPSGAAACSRASRSAAPSPVVPAPIRPRSSRPATPSPRPTTGRSCSDRASCPSSTRCAWAR